MADRFDKFTERARRLLTRSQEYAIAYRHGGIGPLHLLLAMLRDPECSGVRVLSSLTPDIHRVEAEVENALRLKEPLASMPNEIGLMMSGKKVVELCVDEARRLNHEHIGSEHFLLALIRLEGESQHLLQEDFRVSLPEARRAVGLLARSSSESSASSTRQRFAGRAEAPPSEREFVSEAEAIVKQLALRAHPDIPAALTEDQLGFRPYVDAMALMVRHTRPPLTVGILGPWGAGKSSLMRMIRERLEERDDSPNEPDVLTVAFNAWEHKDVDRIWSVLVQQIFQRLEARAGPVGRLRFLVERRWTSWWLLVRPRIMAWGVAALLGVGAVLLPYVASQVWPTWTRVLGSSSLGLLGIVIGVRELSRILQMPASHQVYEFFAKVDPANRPGYLSEIQSDIDYLATRIESNATSTRARNRRRAKSVRVAIFIDELDRCSPDKAVDVIEAVKVVLERRIFVTFLGMDTRVLAKAVEDRYGTMLPPSPHPDGPGMEYLEKIIQLPFWISYKGKEAYLAALSTDPSSAKGESGGSRQLARLPGSSRVSTMADESSPRSNIVEPMILKESDTEVFREFLRYFPDNPRTLKRILNLYRFAKSLGFAPGLERSVLAWILVCDRWPDFAMEVDYRLLQDSAAASSADPGSPEWWRSLVDAFVRTRERAAPTQYSEFTRNLELELLRELTYSHLARQMDSPTLGAIRIVVANDRPFGCGTRPGSPSTS